MTDENTQVALLDDQLPAYLQEQHEEQQDNFDASDVVVPQIQLVQGLSNVLTEFDDAQLGEFWHTGMDRPLGPEVRFVICSRRKRYLLLAPQFDGRGILARSEDAKTWDRTGTWIVAIDKKTKARWEISDLDVEASGLTGWGTYDPEDDASPPAATLFYDYLVLLPDHMDLGPAVISLARSQIKKARKGLNDKISLHRMNGRPMSALAFEARATTASNDAGQEYFAWGFRQVGFAQEELFKQAVRVGEALSTYTTKDESGAAQSDDDIPF